MEYWQKQTINEPLYPDLLWDKPERKDQAGRLLIIGGNLQGFAAPAKAFEYATKQGIGYTRIMLPDALRSTLHAFWTDAVFCPSTPSGSFAQDSKELILNNTLWADGILLPGDLGRNSETAVMLDSILSNINLPVAITKDALDYYLARPHMIIDRQNTLIIGSFSQMQKILKHSGHSDALIFTMPLASLVGTLARFTKEHVCTVITRSDNQFVIASSGRVVSTKRDDIGDIWRLEFATKAIVSLIHHSARPIEALTHSLVA